MNAQVIAYALGTGMAYGLFWWMLYLIRSEKPRFFWKLKFGSRLAIVFAAVFVIFLFLLKPLAIVPSAEKKPSEHASNGQALFKQKQECQQYLPIIQAEAKAEDEEYNQFGSRTTIIGKAFFSPKRNSCLYIFTQTISYLDRSLKPIRPDTSRFVLFDILSNEEVMSEASVKGFEDYWDVQSKFDDKLKEYL